MPSGARSTSTSRGVQFVIPPTYHVSPLRRAVTMYSPMRPPRMRVSSHTVGIAAMNSVHSGSHR